MGLRPGEAYASYFPSWEVTAPQYVTPTPWSLAQLGYRTNEVAYACIDKWMQALSEATAEIYDKTTGDPVDNDEFGIFMEEPCPGLAESDFWSATAMYMRIAGILAWEKNLANDGSLLNIWPMMPQYCSYLRGQGQLMRAINYQPYTGLPALEIPRERIVLFMYFDPNYFGLKPFSPTQVLADVIKVDNNMTAMINQFLQNGAFVGGLLKTEQIITEADAQFARQRWHETHGGPDNAGQVAVLGKGLEFQTTNNTFREMVFPEVDARNETRICMGYEIPPILIGAKSGMDRATYSNYEQARKAWYEEGVTSEWKLLAARATKDILPHFSTNPNHRIRFNVSEVKALQEDRNGAWERAREAYKARIIVRNDALKEMGMDPVEDVALGKEYYTTAMEQYSLTEEDNLDIANADESSDPKEKLKVVGADRVKVTEEEEEEKHFRAFAKRRIKEGKAADIPEFEFKHIPAGRQRQLLSEYGVPDPDAALVLEGLKEIVTLITQQESVK